MLTGWSTVQVNWIKPCILTGIDADKARVTNLSNKFWVTFLICASFWCHYEFNWRHTKATVRETWPSRRIHEMPRLDKILTEIIWSSLFHCLLYSQSIKTPTHVHQFFFLYHDVYYLNSARNRWQPRSQGSLLPALQSVGQVGENPGNEFEPLDITTRRILNKVLYEDGLSWGTIPYPFVYYFRSFSERYLFKFVYLPLTNGYI